MTAIGSRYAFLIFYMTFIYFVAYLSTMAGLSVMTGMGTLPTPTTGELLNPLTLLQSFWSLMQVSSDYFLLGMLLGILSFVALIIIVEMIIDALPL